ncbi:MAG: sensor histidine kinase [Chthoniobacteraceae bacterium]
MNFADALHRQPKWAVVLEALVLVAAIGVADFATGSEVTLLVFYAAPIAIVAWKLDRGWGISFAVLSAIVWWAANLTSHHYGTNAGYALAVFTRSFYFVLVALVIAAVKARQELDRERIAAFERTRELEREIVRASETEQQRIGRDLHDGVCQFLAGTAIAAHTLARKLETRGAPESAAAREIERLIRDAGVQARSMARGIFPVQMGPEGLAAALDELAVFTNRTADGVKVQFLQQGSFSLSDPESRMHLYRIAQEALSNALRHSKAKNITMSLASYGDGLILTIADDGIGIGRKAEESGGLGMKTMTYRAHAIGGELELAAGRPKGPVLTCIVPDIARMSQGEPLAPDDKDR